MLGEEDYEFLWGNFKLNLIQCSPIKNVLILIEAGLSRHWGHRIKI